MRKLLVIMFLIVLFGGIGKANAALWDHGNGYIYDDYYNITWMSDANYAKTSGFDADGRLWYTALYAPQGERTVEDFLTATGWLLPNYGQLSCLYNSYHINAQNPGPFTNLQASFYWSDTGCLGNDRYVLHFGNGTVGGAGLAYEENYILLVRNGDYNPTPNVPVPAAIWLLGSGLVGMLGIKRKLSM